MVSINPASHDFLEDQYCRNDSAGPPARIAIVDPNRTKAELLQNYCRSQWGFDVVALEQLGRAGLAAVIRTHPEIVLASTHLTDMSLRDFILELKANAPATKLILLTHHCSEYLIHSLGTANYHGLIWEAEEGVAALETIIERVRNGLRMVSANIALIQAKLRSAHDSFSKVLTDRHLDVLVCITHSLSDKEIAFQLGCSASTALSHRQQIMRKLNIRSTPKLIRYGLEKGFGAAPLPGKRLRGTC